MTKKSVIRCLLALLLVAYVVVAVILANNAYATAPCAGFDIRITATEGGRNFVTVKEINRLLKQWKLDGTGRAASSVNLQEIENRLNAVDNIEQAQVERMPDNTIRLTITPMIPVARVFDLNGGSYYINRDGKRLTANSRYRLDVPVITGAFTTPANPHDSISTSLSPTHPLPSPSPADLIPLVEKLHADSAWNAITSQIMVEPRTGDIILVPLIRGHVINLGDTSAIDSKLSRVMAVYRKVMPLKGWEYYDTISVKWRGQVVATRRVKSIPEPSIRFDQEGDVEEHDVNSMLVSTSTDTIATAKTSPKPPSKPKG